MIVKNESAVIEKCLNSLKHLIDYWVIFDTGSTDGTQEIVLKCLEGIPGELHESSWVDFAFNRNEALIQAKDRGDYLLFIDADEVWQYSDNFALPDLDKDFYYVNVRELGAAEVKRIGLVSNHLKWKWEGVLHETVTCPQAKTSEILNGVVNICNSAVGARSKDPEKFLKDALVFKQALEKEPMNSRYAFYLAQSYLNAGKYDLALKCFENRIAMESQDVQETYMALYNQGIVYEKLGDLEAALQSFFKAHSCRSTRAEPLLRIATIYRQKGNFLLGYLLSKYALTLPYPSQDVCVEYMTYDYAMLIEFANCALLLGKLEEGLQAGLQLLANPNLPAEIKSHVTNNCAFARSALSQIKN